MKNLKKQKAIFLSLFMMTLFVFTSCSNDDESTTELEELSFEENNTTEDLEAKSGISYRVREWVLHRTPGPAGLGHSGVAFEVQTLNRNGNVIATKFHYGGVENSGGSPYIRPGNTGNEGWYATSNSQRAMFRYVKNAHGYNSYKFGPLGYTSITKINSAINVMRNLKTRGYSLVGNNCMDAAYDVLRVLPVSREPIPALNGTPNMWYSMFDATPGWSSAANF